MALKLFRSTEFAQSRNFSPERQRTAIHPVWIVVLLSVWLALAGNAVLWRSIAHLPELGVGAAWWTALRVAVLIASAHCVVLGLLMWRHTFKTAAWTLMAATAWTSTVLGNTAEFGRLQWPLAIVLLVLLPGVWLWRTNLRRLAPWQNLVQVAGFVSVALTVFAFALLFSFKDLSALSRAHAELRQLVSPFSAAGGVAALEKLLLIGKQ